MRHHIKFVALAAFALLIGGMVLLAPLGSSGPSVAEAQTDNGSGQRETLSGVLNVLRGDPRPGSGDEQHKTEYLLVDDSGQATELSLDEEKTRPLGGPLALNRKQVKVQGTREARAERTREAKAERTKEPDDQLRVEALGLEQEDTTEATASASQPAVSGSQPVVTIMCRFADSTSVTPHEKPWFETLMGGSEPGLDHYWQETSYANINLSGSKVAGWYNLPQPKSYYLPGGSLDWDSAANDCTAAADADVYFPDYKNINLMFNKDLDGYAWGGSMTLNRDLRNNTQTYGMTWMPPWGYGNQAVMDHEMGHSYGLPHSSGPYSKTYDSSWDPMSNTWGSSYCSSGDAQYGCIGANTISFHKNLLGWIPSERKYTATTGSDQSISIDRLGTPASGSNYLMAHIPIGGSTTQFYTVEARRFNEGYDDRVPAEAVVIHKVDTVLDDRNARVVDSDNDGDPNDSGAMWLPGETFTDAANGISVKVTGTTSSGYDVTVNPDPPEIADTFPDNAETGVARSDSLTTTFSEEMDQSTLVTDPATQTSPSVQLKQKQWYKVRKRVRGKIRKVWRYRWVPVTADVRCDETPSPCKITTLDPVSDLLANTTYWATVTTGAKDMTGNALAQNYSWTFTTGSS